MITPLASLAAFVLSAPVPNRTVELSDPRLLVSASGISSVTADGDTAYIVTDNTVKKVVYGSDLRVVDSLPPRSRPWGLSKYVNLGDGLGILAVANTQSDTAFWLVDWKGTSNTAIGPGQTGTRWAGFSSLGFKTIASQGSPYGFSGESNLVGIRTGTNSAIFAGDKGVFQVVASRDQAGSTKLSVVGSKSDSGKFLWSNTSLATNVAEGSSSLAFDFVGNSWSKKVALFHSPYAVDDLGWLKLVDSSYTRSPDNANAWDWGFNLASGTGKCWLHVSRSARLALHNCVVDGKLEQDTMQVPSLAKDTVAYLHQVFTARSASGMSLLAGDSILAFYDWDGYRLPVPAGTLALNKATKSADFGDTTFWHVGGKELRAFRMKTVADADRPTDASGTLDGDQLSLSWSPAAGQKSFFVQVDGDSVDTTIYTSASNTTLRIQLASIAARAASTNPKILWRVADAAGLDATAPSSAINSLEYTAWQQASNGTAGVARIHRNISRFEVHPSAQGIVITSNGTASERLEILDASGRQLGAISTSGTASVEFRTRSKGVLLVRGADQAVKLTRF